MVLHCISRHAEAWCARQRSCRALLQSCSVSLRTLPDPRSSFHICLLRVFLRTGTILSSADLPGGAYCAHVPAALCIL